MTDRTPQPDGTADEPASAHTAYRRLAADAITLAADLLSRIPTGPDSLDGDYSRHRDALDTARAKLDTLQQAARHVDQQLLDRHITNIELDARAVEIETLARELRDQIARAEHDLQMRNDELAELARQVASNDEHLRTVNLRIVDDQRTLDELHADLEEARNRIRDNRQLLERLHSRLTESTADSVAYRAQIDQSRAELNRALRLLSNLTIDSEQLTDLVEHRDRVGDAVGHIADIVKRLTATAEQITQIIDQVADHDANPPGGQPNVTLDDLAIHLYTTIAGELDEIHSRVSSVLDLNDRLTAVRNDPNASPYINPTGGRFEDRPEFLDTLRDRARHRPEPADESPAEAEGPPSTSLPPGFAHDPDDPDT